MGRRRVYAHPDCLPAPVWKSVWPSGTEGLLLLIVLCSTIPFSLLCYIQNVLYFSMAIFSLGSALCGAAQVSRPSSSGRLINQNIVDKLAHCSASPCWHWGRRYCQRCMGHNCRNCWGPETCHLVSSTECNVELLSHRWTPSGRCLQRSYVFSILYKEIYSMWVYRRPRWYWLAMGM